MEELALKIKELQKVINSKIEGLNNGGCIHFAYYFSKRLTELKIPHKIFFTDNAKPIDLRLKQFQAVWHVMIYIKDIGYIDGYKIINRKLIGFERCRFYKHSNPSNNKLDTFRNNGEWNYRYDKSQNTKLSSIINNIIYERNCPRSLSKK